MVTRSISSGANTTPNLGALGANAAISSDQFLQLLLTQIKNQDPLDPIKDSDFAAQLAQFSTLEGMNKLNSNFGDMLLLQELTQGANLVGKSVSYLQAGSPTPQQGVVDSVSVQGGKLQIMIGGNAVALNQLVGITQPGSKN